MTQAIILLHVLSAMIFSGFIFFKRASFRHAVSAGLISLAFPVGGIILVSVVHFMRPKSKPKHGVEAKEEYKIREYIKALNFNDETDTVPLEESLLISDKDQRRLTMLKILKKDVYEYAEFINTALKNEDAETSHYAASSMLHMRRLLDVKMREISRIHTENPDDINVALDYYEVSDMYLRISGLDPYIKDMHRAESTKDLKRIIDGNHSTPQKFVVRLIELLIEAGNFKEAKKYCEIILTAYDENEEKYLALLKSYYQMKDKSSFEMIFRRLKDLDVVFSYNILDIIRFWVGENNEFDETVYYDSSILNTSNSRSANY